MCSHGPPWCMHLEKPSVSSCSYKGSKSIMGASPLWPNYFPRAPPSNAITLKIGDSIFEFRKYSKFGLSQSPDVVIDSGEDRQQMLQPPNERLLSKAIHTTSTSRWLNIYKIENISSGWGNLLIITCIKWLNLKPPLVGNLISCHIKSNQEEVTWTNGRTGSLRPFCPPQKHKFNNNTWTIVLREKSCHMQKHGWPWRKSF